jgi:hypothetical protein
MTGRRRQFVLGVVAILLAASEGFAQQVTRGGQQTDSSRIDPDGTAYVTPDLCTAFEELKRL